MSDISYIPIRQEIEVIEADVRSLNDDFKDNEIIINSNDEIIKRPRTLGWTMYETIGVGVINPKAISRVRKSKDEK